MWATGRWASRLPRTATREIRRKVTKRSVGGKMQRRWLSEPPQQRRAWAAIPGKGVDRDAGSSIQRSQQDEKAQVQPATNDSQVGRNTQLAATLAQSDTSDLVTEVHIPADPHGIIPPDHPALSLLGNSSLVIQRQIEMMNIMLGFEQANRYIIMDGQGQTLGYIAEQDHGIGSAVARQAFRTHRSFTTHIFDAQEREVLRIHRPFAYINSRIRIYDPIPEGGYTGTATSTALQGTSASSAMNSGVVAQTSPLKLDEMRIIGEAQQQWAPLRRKYNLFTYRPLSASPDGESTPAITSSEQPSSATTALTERQTPAPAIEAGLSQFAHVNEPFLSWDFTLRDERQRTMGTVNRSFGGFAREIFTDTGVYALRMDSAAQMRADGTENSAREKEVTALTLDQRAVVLATAVSIDFDYFSRHSRAGGHGMGFWPVFWPMGGGAAEGGAVGAGAGAVGEAGVGAAEGASGAIGGAAARGVTGVGAATESGIAGAGTLAGYEAMQRGVYGDRGGQGRVDEMSPQAPQDPYESGFQGENAGAEARNQAENQGGNDDVWGSGEQDPWGGGSGGAGGGGGGGGGEGGGGGWLDSITDFFS